MLVPPNWFGLAACGLLGAFLNPGFWLIGAGLEGFYLWALSRNPRFRAVVDARSGAAIDPDPRYAALSSRLDAASRQAQAEIEQHAADIVGLLNRSGALSSQIAGVQQLAWLHMRLLATRSALIEVIASATAERRDLEAQSQRVSERLNAPDLPADLRHSLTQQLELIRTRRAAHEDAHRRRELVDAEIERLRQQIALVREQALLAADEGTLAQSLDVLTASLNEANRWLKDQRELFADLESFDEKPPAEIARARPAPPRTRKTGVSQ
jgi:hypothetical protein